MLKEKRSRSVTLSGFGFYPQAKVIKDFTTQIHCAVSLYVCRMRVIISAEDRQHSADYLGRWATTKVLRSMGLDAALIMRENVQVNTLSQSSHQNIILSEYANPDLLIGCKLFDSHIDVSGFASSALLQGKPIREYYGKRVRLFPFKELTDIKLLKVYFGRK